LLSVERDKSQSCPWRDTLDRLVGHHGSTAHREDMAKTPSNQEMAKIAAEREELVAKVEGSIDADLIYLEETPA